jgi:hypothetical protein
MSTATRTAKARGPRFDDSTVRKLAFFNRLTEGMCEREWPMFHDAERPWLLTIWEPLSTKVPNPCLAQPHCCYISTVIFYVKPFVVRPWHDIVCWRGRYELNRPSKGMAYEEWGRAEAELTWDTKVEYDGRIFICGGGSVIWEHKRWWMEHRLRREQVCP